MGDPSLGAEDSALVELFRDFIRIPSTSHTGPASGSYKKAVDFLEAACKERGFSTRVVSMVEGKPILIATKEGSDPSLGSLLLNSHYDVVPAEPALWTMGDPWAADVVDGQIVGRGTQDMKCVCIQHLEGLARALKESGPLKRTVHITFVPDEEIGGQDGLGKFVESDLFKEMNVTMALDEGLANPNDNENTVFYGERAIFWIRLQAKGAVGHGSRFVEGQAVKKIVDTVNRFLEFRAKEEAKFKGLDGCKHGVAYKLGDVVTLNCTMLNAGVTSDHGETYALNVIPSTAEAGFDIRIPPTVGIDEMERMLREMCDKDVEITFVQKVPEHNVSDISDKNTFWKCFCDTLEKDGMKIVPEIFPAGTDSRFLRARGIPAFGFSPMPGTPILLHDNDERLGINTFVDGVNVFAKLITNLANHIPAAE